LIGTDQRNRQNVCPKGVGILRRCWHQNVATPNTV
jgi:hypothetical protein